MDIFMDFSVTSNTSHKTGQEDSKGQGLNRSDPLDMFVGMELLLRFKPLFLPLYCLVVAVAGVGNSILLACILADKKLHNATNFFIGNLAAGDLLMCLSCVPLTVSYAFDSHGWAFGRPLCHLVPLLQCATVFASVLSLTAIAVDRYVVVAHPVRKRISVRGCGAVTLGVWLLSLALAAPPSLYTRYVDLRPSGIDLVCVLLCHHCQPETLLDTGGAIQQSAALEPAEEEDLHSSGGLSSCLRPVLATSAGPEPVAGPGPGLPLHREALHKRLTGLLPLSSYELCVLQPVHLCFTAQQGAHAPERLPLSMPQAPEGNGGEGYVKGLISTCVC